MNGPRMTSNVGLLDQRFAFECIQKNIHLFGVDPFHVTIFGDSAVASSIETHITAHGGGKERSPFKNAIGQSVCVLPTVPLPNSRVKAVISFGNITSINVLQHMSSPSL